MLNHIWCRGRKSLTAPIFLEMTDELAVAKPVLNFLGFVLLAGILSVNGAFGQTNTNGSYRAIKGHVEALRSVVIVPQVEGYVSRVCFSEGGFVAKGTLLYQIESERLQHQLDLCLAELAAATVIVWHTQREYSRMASADSRGVTQVEMEATSLQYETAKSSERQARASLAIATFDLEKTKIFAPMDGRIGASAVWPGSYVSPIHEPLTQIVQVDPIRIVFPIPASEYVNYKSSKTPLDQAFKDIRVILPNGVLYDHPGRVDFENNIINEETGDIYLGASFPNPDQLLLPNASVDVLVERQSKER